MVSIMIIMTIMIIMIIMISVAIARFGRRLGGRWGRGSGGFMASVDRRIPSPAFGALRRRGVGGSRVAWDTATLVVPPVIASGRAVCALGWGRGSWWTTFRQTTVLRGPPEFIVIATLRANSGGNNERDQGGQNSENNFELHVYKSRRVVGVVRNE